MMTNGSSVVESSVVFYLFLYILIMGWNEQADALSGDTSTVWVRVAGSLNIHDMA